MGRCTRTSAEITSIAVPATSKKLVSSNAWPTLATPLRSSHSRPRHKHVEPRSRYLREFAAWPEQVSFFLHAGCRLGSLSASPKLIPEEGSAPGFDIV